MCREQFVIRLREKASTANAYELERDPHARAAIC